MTNFQFFKKYSLKWLYIPWFPAVEVIEERERSDYLMRYSDAWAYYDSEQNRIYVIKKHDCLMLRIHEYGHWFNARLYMFLDALWEFPWWGLGLRSLIDKRK